MHRRIRPLIALVAAYSIMLAAIFAAASAAHAAAGGAPSICASGPAGGEFPGAPARHDLDCCIACGGGSPALPVAGAADISLPAPMRIAWRADSAAFLCPPIKSAPSARAPPASI